MQWVREALGHLLIGKDTPMATTSQPSGAQAQTSGVSSHLLRGTVEMAYYLYRR